MLVSSPQRLLIQQRCRPSVFSAERSAPTPRLCLHGPRDLFRLLADTPPTLFETDSGQVFISVELGTAVKMPSPAGDRDVQSPSFPSDPLEHDGAGLTLPNNGLQKYVSCRHGSLS